MKKFIFISLLISCLSLSTQAQYNDNKAGLKLSTYVEKTINSNHLGTSFVYDFRTNNYAYNQVFSAKVGMFFQQSTLTIFGESPTLHIETSLAGLTGEFEVFRSRYCSIETNVRVAVQNKENFLIIPTVFASLHPFNNISVSAGISKRGLTPTGMIRVMISLN